MKSNINKLCKERGTTLYRLARIVGVTDRTLYKYEKRGLDNAQLWVMAEIAKALNCRIEDLYERKED